MSNILLIETASEVCSVALSVNGEIASFKEDLECKSHVAVITLFIEECLSEAGITTPELDAVAISKGPGSYTSLRTGVSVAKGLCFALDIPLIGIDTLSALAWGAQQVSSSSADAYQVAMLDARRSEVWLAVYDDQLNLIEPAQPLNLEEDGLAHFLEKYPANIRFFLSGNGILKLSNENIPNNAYVCSVKKNSALFLHYFATKCFKFRIFEDSSLMQPVYMKPPNITTPHKPLI